MVNSPKPRNEFEINDLTTEFYQKYNLKRVYYSGYIPVNNSNSVLPQVGTRPPLIRENRLYQTDWLLRFYDFSLNEILNPNFTQLDLDIDPKLSWALRNLHQSPVDINTADYQMIIRIPGIGRQSALKIIAARKFGKLREYQLKKMGIAFNRAKHFMVCADSQNTLGFKYAPQIKNTILSQGNSKYKSQIDSNQLSLF